MNGSPELKIPQSVQPVTPPIGTDRALINRTSFKLAPLYISLYGLFDASGHCWYVGQTIHEQTRRTRHRVSGLNFNFVCFRLCPEKDASRIETQIIRAYKRKSQAELNKNIGGAHGSRESWIVYCTSLGVYFKSKIHAAQFFDCSHASITRALRRKRGWLKSFRGKHNIFQPKDDLAIDLL